MTLLILPDRVGHFHGAAGSRRRDLHPSLPDARDPMRRSSDRRVVFHGRVHADGRKLPRYQSTVSNVFFQI